MDNYSFKKIIEKVTNKNTQSPWILSPVIGTLVFFILYFIATLLYPGGSQLDKNSHGFSWTDNYWCNLLNENAINGSRNPARPIALAGLFVLGITLSLFWTFFPGFANFTKAGKGIIQACGILSMCMAMLLFTSFHDTATTVAGLFGMVALAGTFIGLRKIGWYGLFWFGMLNLLFVAANAYIYYTKQLILYLPLIQKISFALFLTWISCISVHMNNKLIREQ